MKKIFIIAVLIFLVGYFFYTKILVLKEADYRFIGKYKYRIANKNSVDSTCLSKNSFGFLISNLPLSGIEISDIKLLPNSDYIFSLDHPIKSVYTDSKAVRGEAQEHLKKKGLEIIKDTSLSENYIFVYSINPPGKYRLLQP